MDYGLTGKVAIVTGAGGGIGNAIARQFIAEGCRVLGADLNPAAVDGLGTPDQVIGYEVDLSTPNGPGDAVSAALDAFGQVDILVNNAGVTRDTLLPRMSDQEWDEVITTNLRGPFLFMRAASRPMMQQRYGRIVNVASVSGLIGNPGQANYSASKAGLVGLTRTVAKELGGRKITVNAVAPGFIASDMTAALGPALLDEVKKRVPAKRLGEAWEIAEAVLFLVSPSSGYITAQTLVVDGGLIG